MTTLFITGIDTDAGKTIATGHLAKYLKEKGLNVITQKMVQTGCTGIAEDILTHRKIMNCELFPEDFKHITCPQTFHYPASPHLSASLENQEINIEAISAATTELNQKYGIVLLEGAGGLHVPLNDTMHIIDYIEKQNFPTILVTSSKLGSINHTLLSLEALNQRNIPILGLIYNHYPNNSQLIFEDTRKMLKQLLPKYAPNALFWDLPQCNSENKTVAFKGLHPRASL